MDKKEIIVRKGERTLVRYGVPLAFLAGAPRTSFPFTAQRLGGGDPGGEVEILRSAFLKRKPPERIPLQRTHEITLEFGITDYAVYVTPDEDVRIIYAAGSLAPKVAGFLLTSAFVAFATWEALKWLWLGR